MAAAIVTALREHDWSKAAAVKKVSAEKGIRGLKGVHDNVSRSVANELVIVAYYDFLEIIRNDTADDEGMLEHMRLWFRHFC